MTLDIVDTLVCLTDRYSPSLVITPCPQHFEESSQPAGPFMIFPATMQFTRDQRLTAFCPVWGLMTNCSTFPVHLQKVRFNSFASFNKTLVA